jgi:hypothetical protein
MGERSHRGGRVHRVDDEHVLVLNHLSGQGKASGLEVGQMERNGAAILHCRDGKVTRYVSYNDGDRALADLRAAGVAASYRFGREAAIRFAWKAVLPPGR